METRSSKALRVGSGPLTSWPVLGEPRGGWARTGGIDGVTTDPHGSVLRGQHLQVQLQAILLGAAWLLAQAAGCFWQPLLWAHRVVVICQLAALCAARHAVLTLLYGSLKIREGTYPKESEKIQKKPRTTQVPDVSTGSSSG